MFFCTSRQQRVLPLEVLFYYNQLVKTDSHTLSVLINAVPGWLHPGTIQERPKPLLCKLFRELEQDCTYTDILCLYAISGILDKIFISIIFKNRINQDKYGT